MKKLLKTYVLLENTNNTCLTKRKNTDRIPYAKRKSAQYAK